MLMGFATFALSSSPIMAADIASNTAQEQVAIALFNKGFVLAGYIAMRKPFTRIMT